MTEWVGIVGMVGLAAMLLWNFVHLAYLVARHYNPLPVRTCEFCHYYAAGACKRYPPMRVYTGDTSKDSTALDVSVWPVVKVDNWCGEWKEQKA